MPHLHLIVARPLWLAALLLVVLLPAPGLADKKGVRIDGKAPAEYVAAQAGKSWAVVIGINEYEHVRPLQYAVADAQAVAQALRQRGFQVAELYDRDATRGRILGELGDKLVDRVGENDRVLIFYSGHGETKQPKGGKEMGFLLPVGAKADALAETAIPMSVIRDLADELPSKQVLFLVDVCYGGIAGTQFKSVLKYDEAYLREITRERGRQLITAGGPKQEALEGPEWGHSVFTYYLLEGLTKGLADLDEDGIIPASELHTYLTRRVFDAAQSKGHRQRPEMWKLANEPGEFVFFTSVRGGTTAAPAAGDRLPTLSPGPSAALSQAAQELKALEEQERQMDEAERQATLQRQIEEKKRQLDEKKKKIELAKAYDLPRQTGREITGRDGAPMLLVPEGEFQYGTNNQRLSLSAFYMDKYEVTTKLYAAFLQATSRKQPDDWNQVSLTSVGDRPVVGVDWHDADAYCRHYGKRLPTEQEWEKAARGTDGRKYPWGNDEPSSRYANYGQSYDSNFYSTRLTAIGNYEAGKSPYGIYDLAGNVWEWTSSDYDSSNKVLRGGSWYLPAISLVSAYRTRNSPSKRLNYIGFRCVQDAS